MANSRFICAIGVLVAIWAGLAHSAVIPVVNTDASKVITLLNIPLEGGVIVRLKSVDRDCEYLGETDVEMEKTGRQWLIFPEREVVMVRVDVTRKVCGNVEERIAPSESFYLRKPVPKGSEMTIPFGALGVEWFKANDDERQALLESCPKDPGHLEAAPKCINAVEAERQLSSGALRTIENW